MLVPKNFLFNPLGLFQATQTRLNAPAPKVDRPANQQKAKDTKKTEDLYADLKKSGLKPKYTKDGVVVSVQAAVLFDYDKSHLRPDSKTALNNIARIIGKHAVGKDVYVSGHTCQKGEPEYNQKLSERRASSVEAYLRKEGKISNKIIARGHGESKPKIAAPKSEAEFAQNRRVEILVKMPAPTQPQPTAVLAPAVKPPPAQPPAAQPPAAPVKKAQTNPFFGPSVLAAAPAAPRLAPPLTMASPLPKPQQTEPAKQIAVAPSGPPPLPLKEDHVKYLRRHINMGLRNHEGARLVTLTPEQKKNYETLLEMGKMTDASLTTALQRSGDKALRNAFKWEDVCKNLEAQFDRACAQKTRLEHNRAILVDSGESEPIRMRRWTAARNAPIESIARNLRKFDHEKEAKLLEQYNSTIKDRYDLVDALLKGEVPVAVRNSVIALPFYSVEYEDVHRAAQLYGTEATRKDYAQSQPPGRG